MIALRLVLTLLSLGLAASLRADRGTTPATNPAVAPAAGESAPTVRRGASPLAAALDFDRDGTLSAVEIGQAPVLLRALDTDADGALSAPELRHEPMFRRTARPSTVGAKVIQVRHLFPGFNLAFTLDANHDGEIQAMEIANAVSSLKTLDTDGDSQISSREMRPTTTTVAMAM